MNSQSKVFFTNIEELNDFAAQLFVDIYESATEFGAAMTVALAGGSTPQSLYRLLASGKYNDKINWSNIYFFFGDERNVLPNHEESNFRMANENLFTPLKVPPDQIYRWETELLDAEKIADAYNEFLKYFFDTDEDGSFPSFDLVLLGMGDDGHTASLFPNTSALHETRKFAVANRVEKHDTTRLTLTFPVINNAENVIYLVAGEAKAKILHEVFEGDFEPDRLPSQYVKPQNGNLFWLLDEKAAALLKQK